MEKEQKSIEELLKTSTDGKIIREGIETVIVGKPNAGKSSLLNLLVGENKAIVTDIEGTTRDILEEYSTLHGITLKIVDTAGIREKEMWWRNPVFQGTGGCKVQIWCYT